MQTRVGTAIAFILALFAVSRAAPCAAQDVPYAELGAGYNFLRYQDLESGSNAIKGVFGDVALNLNHAVGLVGVVTTNTVIDIRAVSFTGGLRFSARGFARGPGRAIGFFQILAGGIGFSDSEGSSVHRAIQIGGGANVTVTDHAMIRAEADFIRTYSTENIVSGLNYIRFSVGVAYGFGAH
jgi:hypothetical protein